MKELLDFLEKRVEYLRGFGEEVDDEEMDGEETFEAGVEEGRFKEAVFLRDKIEKMLSE